MIGTRIGGAAGLVFGLIAILVPLLFSGFFAEGPLADVDLNDPVEAREALKTVPEVYLTRDTLLFAFAEAGLIFTVALYNRIKTDSPRVALLAAIGGALGFLTQLVDWILSVTALPYLVEEHALGGKVVVSGSSAYFRLDEALNILELGILFTALWLLLSGLAIVVSRGLPRPVGYLGVASGVMIVPYLIVTDLGGPSDALFIIAFALIGVFSISAGAALFGWPHRQRQA